MGARISQLTRAREEGLGCHRRAQATAEVDLRIGEAKAAINLPGQSGLVPNGLSRVLLFGCSLGFPATRGGNACLEVQEDAPVRWSAASTVHSVRVQYGVLAYSKSLSCPMFV